MLIVIYWGFYFLKENIIPKETYDWLDVPCL